MLDQVGNVVGNSAYDWSASTAEYRSVFARTRESTESVDVQRSPASVGGSSQSDRAAAGIPVLEESLVVPGEREAVALAEKLGGANRKWDFAELIVMFNLEWWKAVRQDRQIARDLDIAAQEAAAKTLRDGAKLQLLGTLLTGVAAGIGAGFSIRGASKAHSEYAKLSNPPKPATPPAQPDSNRANGQSGPDDSYAHLNNGMQASQRIAMKWNGLATLVSESGKLGGGGSNYAAAFEQEEKAKLEAESTKMRARAEDQTEFKGAYEKMMENMVSALTEIRQSNAEAMGKIVNMG